MVSIADIQVENRQYDMGHFDFAVVLSTCSEIKPVQTWPTLWNIFHDNEAFILKYDSNHLTVRMHFEQWENCYAQYTGNNKYCLTKYNLETCFIRNFLNSCIIRIL